MAQKNADLSHWFEALLKAKVEAASIEDFIERYYRPDRYRRSPHCADFPDYPALVLKSHRENFESRGFDWIGHFESVTGDMVCWFGENEPAAMFARVQGQQRGEEPKAETGQLGLF